MSRQKDYYRPGISAITVTEAGPDAVLDHIRSVQPYVEELVVVVIGKAIPAMGSVPSRVRLISLPLLEHPEDGRRKEAVRVGTRGFEA